MTNTPSPTDEDRELIEARTLLVEFIADQFDDGTRSQEYWDWFNGEIGTRLESLLSDRAKLEEALERAAENFDRLTVPHIVGNDVHNFAFQAAKLARAALNRSIDR